MQPKIRHLPERSRQTPSIPDEWGIGNPDAKLRIVEFGDYQCGACGFYHPIVKEVMEEYEDDVYFVWHHFPLVNTHQFAVMAASASRGSWSDRVSSGKCTI